jgi:hypothetical protein
MTVSSFRRWAGPASPIALFVALLVSTAFDPLGDNHDNAVQLHKATGHSGAVVASAAFELVAAAVTPVAVLWLVQLVRGRGRGLANAGGVLGVAGAVGMTMIGVHQLFVAALADVDASNGVTVLNKLDHLVGPLPVLFFFVPLALVLLAIAVHRAGLVPLWVPVAAGVFFVVEFTPIPGAELIQLLVGLGVFATIALRSLQASQLHAAPAGA